MATDNLTPKQKAFCDEYLISFNATDAARKAGYKNNGKTIRAVASENLTKPDIIAYLAKRFNKAAEKSEKRIINTYEEFLANLEFVQKLRDASAKWLVDPEDESKFTIDPRSDEIDIVYIDNSGQKPVEKRASLAELLERIEGRYYSPTPFVKTVDLREYALKTVDRIDTTLDKFAKLGGEYQKERPNDEALTGCMKSYDTLLAQFKADHEDREPDAEEREVLMAMVLELNGHRVDAGAFSKAIEKAVQLGSVG